MLKVFRAALVITIVVGLCLFVVAQQTPAPKKQDQGCSCCAKTADGKVDPKLAKCCNSDKCKRDAAGNCTAECCKKGADGKMTCVGGCCDHGAAGADHKGHDHSKMADGAKCMRKAADCCGGMKAKASAK